MKSWEIFRDVADFKTTEQMCYFEWGYWPDTIKRWKQEGLGSIDKLREELGMAEVKGRGFNTHICPVFDESEIIEETENTVIRREWNGAIVEQTKGPMSFPKFLEFPVKDRKSYYRWREERLNPNDPRRFQDFEGEPLLDAQAVEMASCRDHIYWGAGFRDGFFGWPRELLGLERFMIMLFEDPQLIHEIQRDHLEMIKTVYSQVLPKIDFDFMFIWEDMSYNKGMLISPDMVRRFMLPYYRKLINFYKSYGHTRFFVDSDGDVNELIPLLMSEGVNGMLPFEVAAGMDVVEIRKKYPGFVIFGGIDKREIAKGPDAIDRELERVIPAMKQTGGYFPTIDHHVSPDISLENFKYYHRRLQQYWS
ncbi:MAG: uroporphyrinogen decarboxylase family protein [Planctomycetota bacterium]